MKEHTEWRLSDAKNRDYEKSTGTLPSFKQFLLGDSASLERLNIKRDRSPMRKVKP